MIILRFRFDYCISNYVLDLFSSLSDKMFAKMHLCALFWAGGRCEIAAFLLSMNELTGAVSIRVNLILEIQYISFTKLVAAVEKLKFKSLKLKYCPWKCSSPCICSHFIKRKEILLTLILKKRSMFKFSILSQDL